MNLTVRMNRGISRIMKAVGRYYLKNREGRALLAQMLPRIQACAAIRARHEENGTHIPSFLIASIASQCNLRCAGCYATANGACGGEAAGRSDLSAAKWEALFGEAAELGIPFILLAGGEPFLRRDVMEASARTKDIVFPVFTNGTLVDEAYLSLLDQNRNIIPVLSVEGDAEKTDTRRGEGVYATVRETMLRLRNKGILFGVSITVTGENMRSVTEWDSIALLRDMGCGLVFFVEYVPVSEGTGHLTLNEDDLDVLARRVSALKEKAGDMAILSFPGDEEAMGGCLASGRGFFHINSAGGAEPCPFSPYAKQSLRDCSILDVLKSDYFARLREIARDAGAHTGGCTLFEHREQVAAELLQRLQG